jgi:putative PIG3 family NAD(P)H quinone oxidoreductase
MKAVTLTQFGDPGVLSITERDKPIPKSEELLIEVHAAAMNRADLLQRQGRYPAPEGSSDILGLEVAGEVVACGDNVTDFKPGDKVFGLVGGGGYAEYCVIDQGLALKIPTAWTYSEAAAIIEAFVTANETIFELGNLSEGQRIMIHAGGSGVGTAGIQMAKLVGAEIWTTAGSEKKIQKTIELGAKEGINYKITDFQQAILEQTQGQGLDVVEDFIGAGYFEKNLAILKPGGILVQVGLMRGTRSELDLRMLLDKHLQIKGFILRKRTLSEKRAMVKRFADRWMSVLEKGQLRPIIDSVFPMNMVQEAHRYMESNSNFGKVVLSWDDMIS